MVTRVLKIALMTFISIYKLKFFKHTSKVFCNNANHFAEIFILVSAVILKSKDYHRKFNFGKHILYAENKAEMSNFVSILAKKVLLGKQE